MTATTFWTLVDESGKPTYGIDTTTQEKIVYKRVPAECVAGVFSVSLWPTDLESSDRELYYRCDIPLYRVTLIHPFYEIGGPYDTPFSAWAGLDFLPTHTIITEGGSPIITEDNMTFNTEAL